jgi:hypothetical protein
LHNHAPPSVGHKGLFFERLDAGIARWRGSPGPNGELTEPTPQLEPHARGLYYVRNRWLDPHRGRWLTSDPNSTGQPTHDLAWHGSEVECELQKVHFGHLMTDGTSLYEYVRSNPVRGSDPTGLFDMSIAGLLFGSTNMVDLQSDWAQQVAETGGSAFSAVDEHFAEWSASYAMDLDWATDWSQADDAYSQHSTESRRALREDFTYLLGIMDGSGGTGGHVVAWGQKHHILPKFLGGLDNGALKKLTKAHHKMFHKMLNEKLKDKFGVAANDKTGFWKRKVAGGGKHKKAVKQALLDAYREFKDKTGIDLSGDLEDEIRKQGW